MESYPPCLPTLEELMRITLYDYPNAIEALEQNQWLKSSEKMVGVYRHRGMGKQS